VNEAFSAAVARAAVSASVGDVAHPWSAPPTPAASSTATSAPATFVIRMMMSAFVSA
jgi:hypothetical protein